MITAVSAETARAWRKTSIPLIPGMRISQISKSYRAESSLRMAASPEFVVSTLCPSLRNMISSISQIERTSSQTRMLATNTSGYYHRGIISTLYRRLRARDGKFRSATRRRCDVDGCLVSLHNLVNDGQTKPCTAFKTRLEWLKNLVSVLCGNSRTMIAERNKPGTVLGPYCDFKF